MRAEKMTCFDSVIPNASAAIKSVHEQGKKFVGFYCIFAPQELIIAADAVPVTLCFSFFDSTIRYRLASARVHFPRKKKNPDFFPV
jgi:benzoyl-CoA reductase/2-hydroxyglutaryl-CoA dehydratase subunit BcrC/BadD/HgdB